MIAKARADQLVFEQGLAESKEQARRLIMAGKVALAPDEEHPERAPELVQKPGHPYKITTQFQLVGVERFVSRGAYKLLTALERYHIDVKGFVCLDAGASTGGFTDCMLQNGARRVYAVDVGYGQLDWKLRSDERVVCLERTNARYLSTEQIPEPLDFASIDVSFISLTMVLPHCLRWLKDGGIAVGLIKPQFEVGPGQTVKGVVRDEAVRQDAVDRVLAFMEQEGLQCLGVTPAAIKGPKGNQEFLAYWRKSEKATPQP